MVERYQEIEKDEARTSGIIGTEYDKLNKGIVNIFECMDEAKQFGKTKVSDLLSRQV